MAISVPKASASVSSSIVDETLTSRFSKVHIQSYSKVSFSLAPKPKLRLFSKGTRTISSRTIAVKAQVSKVVVDGFSNNAANPEAQSRPPARESTNEQPRQSYPPVLASEESIAEFMGQVASLVKLVDSKDIAELQLKQLDYEILIRKKEAIVNTQSPVLMMQSPSPAVVSQPPARPPPTPNLALPAQLPAAKSAKSLFPPLKCPMAGTFYRSPAPGEKPFVKIGDKVQKGQVLCIIEAMKLMNEIEADQSGTLVEILAEDGKPVSLDTPLFVIQP